MTDFEDPLIGAQCGEYRLEALLGAGGMGRVYRARHQMLNRVVALKLLSARVATDEQYVQRFMREAKLASSLHHAGLVEVYDCGKSEHGYYMIMELIDGMSLGALLHASGKLSEEQVLDVAEATLSALEYAHQAGVIHRDIKPDNLLVQQDGSLKLTDLGLAKSSTSEEDAGLTQSGMVLGTPYYVSPEQVQGSKSVDARTDLYSLGATLYHCATGSYPFTGDSQAMIMNKHLNEPPQNPKHRVPELSEAFSIFILRLMNKNPDYRFASASEAKGAVQRIRSLKEDPQQKVKEVVFLDEAPSRKGMGIALVSGFCVLLASAGVWYGWQRSKSAEPTALPTVASSGGQEEIRNTPPVTPSLPPKEVPAPEPMTVIPKPVSASPVQWGTYKVQVLNMVQDGGFRAKAGESVELMHSDVLTLSAVDQIYFHFDLTTIWERMNMDLGQAPQIRRVDFVLQNKIVRAQSGTKLKVWRLQKGITDGFHPSERPASELALPDVGKGGPMIFNITDVVVQGIQKDNHGWVLTLDGEGDVLIASSQDPRPENIPMLIFTIGVDPSKVPAKAENPPH